MDSSKWIILFSKFIFRYAVDYDYTPLNGLFNWTMSLRRDSEVTMAYGSWHKLDVPLTKEVRVQAQTLEDA